MAPFLDLRRAAGPADDQIPADFTGGCFTGVTTNWLWCSGHVKHSDDINKDKELIDTATGVVSDPVSPRSAIVVGGVSNGQRAVDDAAKEARRQWAVLRAELIQRFGAAKGATMACALTMDDTSVCNTRNIVAVVDTSTTPARTTGARAAQATDTPSAAAGQALLDRLTPSDRVSVLTFDSSDGAQDADPFTAPRDAAIDEAGRATPPPTRPRRTRTSPTRPTPRWSRRRTRPERPPRPPKRCSPTATTSRPAAPTRPSPSRPPRPPRAGADAPDDDAGRRPSRAARATRPPTPWPAPPRCWPTRTRPPASAAW